MRDCTEGQRRTVDLISSIQSKAIRKIMKETMNVNSVAIEPTSMSLHLPYILSKPHAKNRRNHSLLIS